MGKDIFITLSLVGVLLASACMPAEGKDADGDSALSSQAGRSEFFCGYCHTLTYPRVMKKAYTSWKAGKHKDVGCVECHYPPERLRDNIPQHKKIPKDKRYAGERSEWDFMRTELEVLSRLTTILNMNEPVVRTKPRIDDLSCTSTRCHPATGKGKEGEYWTKKIDYAQYERADKTKGIVQFVHDKHFEKKKWIEGQELHCTTCHQRESEKKHFEVSKEKCFLCHFKNTAFNTDRAKCALCHEIPTKPLQTQKKEAKPGEKPVTHKTMEEAKVGCQSCHLHLIHGNAQVSSEKCLNCHDNEATVMKEVKNKKLMHKEHVAGQAASCFNCHEPIEHKERDFLDTARESCTVCHPDHHKYQKLLLIGAERKGIPKTPGLMSSVKTNCFGCHLEERKVKGEKVAHGSGKACAACHTEKHEGMVKQWKDKIDKELKSAKEIEEEAQVAIKNAEGKKPAKNLAEARAMLEKGRESMQLVEFGGGVHNQKYSVMLLDVAMNNFEDAIDLLKD